MESKKTKFGILKKKIDPKQNLGEIDLRENYEKLAALEPGTLLDLISNTLSLYEVKVLDYLNQDNMILHIVYFCPADCIKTIDEHLWPYIIAIHDPYIRLQFAMNHDLCKEILSINVDDFVTVNGSIFNKSKNFSCIVRYIGLVREMGPGFYFILELLNFVSGNSPQSNDINYAKNYVNLNSDITLIVACNAVTKSGSTRKYTLDFLSSTFQKAKQSLTYDNSNMDHKLKSSNKKTTTSTNQKANLIKPNKSTNTNFYDGSNLENDSQKISKPIIESNKPQSLNDNDDICDNLQNESMSEFVENHEKCLERQHRNNKISSEFTHNKTITKPKKQLPQADVKQLNSTRSEVGDVVVIDKDYIKESTKNESQVLVVENPKKYIELIEVVGTNWPKNAGDAAEMLNSYKFKNHLKNKQTTDNYKNDNLKKLKKCTDEIYDNKNVTNIAVPSTLPKEEFIPPSPLPELDIDVGTMVEVPIDGCKGLYGVVRWYGHPQGEKSIMVGVELEENPSAKSIKTSNGSLNGVQLFKCPPGRGIFVHPYKCLIDQRFLDIDEPSNKLYTKEIDTKMFGQVECPIVPGIIPSYKIYNLEDLEAMTGQFKGIQGHHNSCYLDATLFAMFTFTSVFDSLLYRRAEPEDNTHYIEVQTVLRDEIVNPLRTNLFVRADRVMKLRQLLEKLSSVTGLTSEEKDPEEFLNSLLAQILRADPFLKLSSGQDAFFYQLFVEKDERVNFPTVQQLFQQSFLASDIKLREVPSCLIIQMPRFGKNYKMYERILPTQLLDVTDIIEDSPRQCAICGELAEYECHECFGLIPAMDGSAFCKNCVEKLHINRKNHFPKKISVPQEFKGMDNVTPVPRVFMELFAVVCIETSHYVAFVKTGCGQDVPWCFFDSMADRRGEQNGYNIPEMVSVPDLPQWLENKDRDSNNLATNDKKLPEHAKRLLCDAYMCMYQSTDVMMYR